MELLEKSSDNNFSSLSIKNYLRTQSVESTAKNRVTFNLRPPMPKSDLSYYSQMPTVEHINLSVFATPDFECFWARKGRLTSNFKPQPF